MFASKLQQLVRAGAALVALVAILSAAAAHAADEMDLSKLKKGDRLEAQFGTKWEPVEFVESVGDRIAKVKREGRTLPIGVLANMLRPASGAKDAAAAEDPFMTQEERAAQHKPRTWTDPTGKYKTEATFVRVADNRVVLKRTDGKEVSVPLDRLAAADQRYVASLTKPRAAPAPAAGRRQPARAQPADARDVELTETDLRAAEVVALAQIDAWYYEPDPARDTSPMPKVRVPLRSGSSVFDKPEAVILLPGEQKAFVVSVDHHPRSKVYDSTLQQCSLELRKVEAAGRFASGAAPVDVSPDGKTLLARTVGFGFGVAAELRLYQRGPSATAPIKAWTPYRSPGQPTSQSHDADVHWARFLDPDHVIAMSAGGMLSLWEVPGLRPIYQAQAVKGTRPGLSAGGRYVAIAIDSGIAILQANDGQLVGTLPADLGQASYCALAFSPSGARLALVQGSRIRVWDLSNRKLHREFYAPVTHSATHGPPAIWMDDTYLLVSGTTLVDVEHYASVWTYSGLGCVGGVDQGRLWFVESRVQGESVLASEAVPSSTLRAKFSKMPADALLAVKPGMEISIELPADAKAQEVRQHMTRSLTERGMKVVPSANLRLVGTIRPGETKLTEYQRFGAPPGSGTPHKVTEIVLTLSLNLGPDTVWKNESKVAPPSFLRLEENQSAEEAISAYMRRDSSAFQNIWIPVYVAKPDSAAGTSRSPAG